MMNNMKKILLAFATMALAGGAFTACEDDLDVKNPNYQTTYDFGDEASELEEAIIAGYNRIRLEGTFARVGYTMDAVRGDEVWNSSQQWYLVYDNLNSPNTDEIGNQWIWRDCYHVVNRANFVITKSDENRSNLSDSDYNQLRGQALFLRALAYYEIATYQQTAPLYTDYNQYSSLDGMYAASATIDELFDQMEADLSEAMQILPSRDEGGEWAQGRATCGAAAGYYARVLMFRHKYSEALAVLKDIIAGSYGHYKLMADYGDNCREGSEYENNAESLFEVQFMDYGTGGTDEEWTPVNISRVATQGHAVESNYGSGPLGSWGDLAVSPWLYNLFKAEKTTDGKLDPRLYWTVVSYEPEYDTYTNSKNDAYPNGDPRQNMAYQATLTETPLSNASNGGISIAKCTNARNNYYASITTGLHCGLNLRLMRYSDVLLRAAECENEVNGPTQQAIDWINEVRNRVALPDLKLSDFSSADKLFEQIANVERPKEFGCENGRGIDIIRWGFFYSSDRLAQLIQHGSYLRDGTANTAEVSYADGTADDSSFQYWRTGHEYFPIAQSTMNDNPNVVGNSANNNTDNSEWYKANGWTIHPVVDLD